MRKVPRSKTRCTPSLDALEVRDLLSGMTAPAYFESASLPAAELPPPIMMDHPRFDLIAGRSALAIEPGRFTIDLGEFDPGRAGPDLFPYPGPEGKWERMEARALAATANFTFGDPSPAPISALTISQQVGSVSIGRPSPLGWLESRRASTFAIAPLPMSEPFYLDYGGEEGGDFSFSPMAAGASPAIFVSRGSTMSFKGMGRPMPKLPPMRDMFAVISLYEVGKPETAAGELDTSPIETICIVPVGNMVSAVAQALMGGERVVAQIGIPSTPEWLDLTLEGEAGANTSVNLESLTWQLDAAPGAADAPPATPDAVAAPPAEEGEAPEPREAGLITDFLPVDIAALDESLSRFLDRFDELTPDLEEVNGFPTAPILIVSAFLTFEATRRYRNRRFLTGNQPVARERSSTLHGFS